MSVDDMPGETQMPKSFIDTESATSVKHHKWHHNQEAAPQYLYIEAGSTVFL